MVSFSEPSKPNTKLEIYKKFHDRLPFLNRHMSRRDSWRLPFFFGKDIDSKLVP